MFRKCFQSQWARLVHPFLFCFFFVCFLIWHRLVVLHIFSSDFVFKSYRWRYNGVRHIKEKTRRNWVERQQFFFFCLLFSITIADKLKNLQLLPFVIIRRSMLCYERCQYNRCFRKQVEMSTASHLFSFFISFFVVVPNIAALLTTNIRILYINIEHFILLFFFNPCLTLVEW